ncbi:hypothetical protein [Iodobacter fluviatilis]|uniref:Uncharacterized protein n=1 Tax=Iodobacter fluviatilis TaxID=537 RepID=A0A7G3GBM2_9NEIS|nr:hypothetical protein [Iodobacter fluviatilis]QBC44442.1 hypothetical protein C1H71_13485 [Iodobacter fluviatilis]
MQINELRAHLIKRLIAGYPTQEAFAIAVGVESSTLTRCLGPRPSRSIGPKLCEKIELSLGLNSGHLSDFGALIDLAGILRSTHFEQHHPNQLQLIANLVVHPLTPEQALLINQLVSQLNKYPI